MDAQDAAAVPRVVRVVRVRQITGYHSHRDCPTEESPTPRRADAIETVNQHLKAIEDILQHEASEPSGSHRIMAAMALMLAMTILLGSCEGG